MSRETNPIKLSDLTSNDAAVYAKKILNLGFDKVLFDDLVNQATDKDSKASLKDFLNLCVANCISIRIKPGDRGFKILESGEKEYTVDKLEQLRAFQNFLNRHQIDIKGGLNGNSDMINAALNADIVDSTTDSVFFSLESLEASAPTPQIDLKNEPMPSLENIDLSIFILKYNTKKDNFNVKEIWKRVAEVTLNAKPETVTTVLNDLLTKGSKMQTGGGRFHVPNEIGPIKDLMNIVVTYCLGCVEPDQMANMRVLFDFLDTNHINVRHILNSSLGEIILEGNHELAYLLLAQGAVPKDAMSLIDDDRYKDFIQEARNKGKISEENLHKFLPKTPKDDVSVVVSAMTQTGSGRGLFRNPTSASPTAEGEIPTLSPLVIPGCE